MSESILNHFLDNLKNNHPVFYNICVTVLFIGLFIVGIFFVSNFLFEKSIQANNEMIRLQETKITQLEKELSSCKDSKKECQQTIKGLNQSLSTCQKQMAVSKDSSKSKQSILSRIEALNHKLKTKQEELEQLRLQRQDLSRGSIDLSFIDQQIDDIKNKIREIGQEIYQLNDKL